MNIKNYGKKGKTGFKWLTIGISWVCFQHGVTSQKTEILTVMEIQVPQKCGRNSLTKWVTVSSMELRGNSFQNCREGPWEYSLDFGVCNGLRQSWDPYQQAGTAPRAVSVISIGNPISLRVGHTRGCRGAGTCHAHLTLSRQQYSLWPWQITPSKRKQAERLIHYSYVLYMGETTGSNDGSKMWTILLNVGGPLQRYIALRLRRQNS